MDGILREKRNLPPLITKVGLLSVNFQCLAKQLQGHITRWKVDFSEALHTIGQRQLSSIKQRLDKFLSILDMKPNDMESLAIVLECIVDIWDNNVDIELHISNLKNIYFILDKHAVSVAPDEINVVNGLSQVWRGLFLDSKTKDLRLESQKRKFRLMTQNATCEFLTDLAQERREFETNGPGSSSKSLEDGQY